MDRKRHLIVIAVFAGIGLIGGILFGIFNEDIASLGLLENIKSTVILTVISAFFGLCIVPWLRYVREEWHIHIRDDGFSGSFIVWMLIQMMWATIRSPFVAIYQLVSDNY